MSGTLRSGGGGSSSAGWCWAKGASPSICPRSSAVNGAERCASRFTTGGAASACGWYGGGGLVTRAMQRDDGECGDGESMMANAMMMVNAVMVNAQNPNNK